MTEPIRVEAINGPVPADHPSHALRLEAAKDFVARCERQLEKAKTRDKERLPWFRDQLAEAKAALELVIDQQKGL